jgi:predicted NBD/HSP70 family sugar kinase
VPDGPVCVGGRRGCLEALAATPAILERARSLARAGRAPGLEERLGHSIEALTRQEFLVAAHAGDPAALEVLAEAANYIGVAVGHLINLYNPQRVILGGLASTAPAAFLDAIRAAARRHAFDVPWRAVEIVLADLGADAVAIVSAALLLSGFLQPGPAVFPLP